MRALRIHERGGPERLVEEEAPVATPTIGDALFRVYAASFTPTALDWPSTWVILGHEVSGLVTALGWGTTGVSVGDAVYGLTDWYRDGTAAEYVAVEAHNLAHKPHALDKATAAAVPMIARTAMQGLAKHRGRLAGKAVLRVVDDGTARGSAESTVAERFTERQ